MIRFTTESSGARTTVRIHESGDTSYAVALTRDELLSLREAVEGALAGRTRRTARQFAEAEPELFARLKGVLEAEGEDAFPVVAFEFESDGRGRHSAVCVTPDSDGTALTLATFDLGPDTGGEWLES